jgi:uncharacterized membrane protein YgcG
MAVLVTVLAVPAVAQTSGVVPVPLPAEHIAAYDIAVDVQANGSAHVIETIDYDFGALSRHGIFRDIITRQRVDAAATGFGGEGASGASYDSGRYDRVYPLKVISVQATNASGKYSVEDGGGGKQRIRIGDADKLVTGRHTYRIEYTLGGVVNPQVGDDEFFWNIVGTEWTVPIQSVTATVTVPGGTTKVDCFVGGYGSTEKCLSSSVVGAQGVFKAGTLFAGQGMTVVVSIPDTDGPDVEPKPILEERLTFARGFEATPPKIAGAAIVTLLAGGLVLLVGWRKGRDRQGSGSAIDAAFANEVGREEGTAVPWRGGAGTPVEFVPPDGIRPGQLGTIKDETADTVDVSATIIDLAVRGFLRIEEVGDGKGKPDDYILHRLPKSDGLLSYESLLLGELFDDVPQVTLSSLKNTFAAKMSKVKTALYQDAMAQGWFAARPDHVRAIWRGVGLALFGVSILLTVVAFQLKLALVTAPLIVVGLALAVFAGRMPRRTPKGTGVNRRVIGFEDFIENSEKHRAQFAERANLFTEYLPYAMVFGATKKWAETFESLGVAPPDTSSWYLGLYALSFANFGDRMNNFSSSASSTLTSTPGGSGSSGFSGGGFSGGGGGGGGGGSW